MTIKELKVLFIVNPTATDSFLRFLFELGYSWFEQDWSKLDKLKEKGILFIKSDDPKLDSLLKTLLKDENSGKFIYLIGCDNLIYQVDIFIHYIYNRKTEWTLFNKVYKQVYGIEFNELLKDT